MNQGLLPELTFAILDFNRNKESLICLQSIKQNCKFEHNILFISNGSDENFYIELYKKGLIDNLILNKSNYGCGIGTKQCYKSCLTQFIIYCQSDQYLLRKFEEYEFNNFKKALLEKRYFCIDLAGRQCGDKFSERASMMETKTYLDIEGMEDIVAGPGPYSNKGMWTEEFIQKYIIKNNLKISSCQLLFANNGKTSIRDMCGGQILWYTDSKLTFLLKPFKFKEGGHPNINWSENEWKMAMDGTWPTEGFIPEADKCHSFECFDGKFSTKPEDFTQI